MRRFDRGLRRIDADVAVDPEVKSLAKAGRKIDAVRRYRSITGAGLKEAKEFVDRP
jgi:ribosomal protein L7/L12